MAKYLDIKNPLSGENFTTEEIFSMQHIPMHLRDTVERTFNAGTKYKEMSPLFDLFMNSPILVSKSLALYAKTVLLPSGTSCIVLSYNLVQLLYNIAVYTAIRHDPTTDDILVSDRTEKLLGVGVDENPLYLAVALKHYTIDAYRKRSLFENPPVKLTGSKKNLQELLLHTMELFILGHEIGHIFCNHIDLMRDLKRKRFRSSKNSFAFVSRHLNKSAEFEADWYGYQFAARFVDSNFPEDQRAVSNMIVLEAVWEYFSLLTQTGDFGSDLHPVPVDRAHVLFLTVWGNQANIPQLNLRAGQIRAMHTAGIGLFEMVPGSAGSDYRRKVEPRKP